MRKLLEGRVAVVTGAGNGIGRAEAIGLAKQGAKVVVNDIGTSAYGQGISQEPADAVVKEIRAAGNTAIACYDSVTTEKGAENIIQTAIDNFGRIDVLINNAGVVKNPEQHRRYQPPTTGKSLMKTHLYGTFYCTRRACAFMKIKTF